MGAMRGFRAVLTTSGRVVNEMVSFVVFCILDLLDVFLCHAFKLLDLAIEYEWRPCYCSPAKEAITSRGQIFVAERGQARVVSVSSTKLQLEEISDTLYTRPSLISEMAISVAEEFRRVMAEAEQPSASSSNPSPPAFTVSPTIVEMLQGKMGGQQAHPIPRWSDCDCTTCTGWISSSKDTLFVYKDGANDSAKESVLFIHGFISSSAFWTETLFPNFSKECKSRYRLFAVDLMGFGRSPKPADSLYTLGDHLEMIERSVLAPHKVKSFHIVAHSLGSILALALAVKYPDAVKTLTLLAPPYFPVPGGEMGPQYVLRRVAPRHVWPPIALGASIGCWYEHISRFACLLICKNHRLWDFLTKLITRNRIRTFLIEGWFCHSHYAAWHTLHNIIFGTAGKIDGYLEAVSDRLSCDVAVFHGRDDDLIPLECSFSLKKKVPRANVKVVDDKDHITIVVCRQKTFARELELIWNRASS